MLLEFAPARGQPRTIADDLDGDVVDAEARSLDQLNCCPKEYFTVGTRESGIVRAEATSEIAEPGRGQQRVADRM